MKRTSRYLNDAVPTERLKSTSSLKKIPYHLRDKIAKEMATTITHPCRGYLSSLEARLKVNPSIGSGSIHIGLGPLSRDKSLWKRPVEATEAVGAINGAPITNDDKRSTGTTGLHMGTKLRLDRMYYIFK